MNGIFRFNQNSCMNCQNCCSCNSNAHQNLQNIFQNQNQNQNCNQNQVIDPAAVANAFLTEYYKNTSLIGWNFVQNMFDHNCVVMLQDTKIGNEYDLLSTLSSMYIKRANYEELRPKWSVINNNSLLINIFGKLQLVSFNGNTSNSVPFSESFVLSLSTVNNNNIVSCTHHMLDL